VDAAFGIVEQNPAKIILLGITPRSTEPEYGSIVPTVDPRNSFPFAAREVDRFIEQPEPAVASVLIAHSWLWNTIANKGYLPISLH